ncbi:MAG: RsmD family RNA methyltransferase [Bacteroidales bacterium]
MRIIGGEHRGIQILPPKTFNARPTTDFAKEGLFNTLANLYNFETVTVLDLFSGTGGITYEFASRGCTNIIAIEMNHIHSNFIKATITKLNLKGVNSVRHNVFDFIKVCHLKFDIIFADPPYDIEGLAGIPDKILSQELLNPGGIFVFEHSAAFNFKEHPLLFKEKKYGNVHFSFFKILTDLG